MTDKYGATKLKGSSGSLYMNLNIRNLRTQQKAMERHSHSSKKHDKVVKEYLSNKAIATSGHAPANTPSTKLVSGTTFAQGLKVLPPIKPASSSLERVSGGNHPVLAPKRNPTEEITRVKNFQTRDLRGGKRHKQTYLSVGKTQKHTDRGIVLSQENSEVKSERKIFSIAQASPST